MSELFDIERNKLRNKIIFISIILIILKIDPFFQSANIFSSDFIKYINRPWFIYIIVGIQLFYILNYSVIVGGDWSARMKESSDLKNQLDRISFEMSAVIKLNENLEKFNESFCSFKDTTNEYFSIPTNDKTSQFFYDIYNSKDVKQFEEALQRKMRTTQTRNAIDDFVDFVKIPDNAVQFTRQLFQTFSSINNRIIKINDNLDGLQKTSEDIKSRLIIGEKTYKIEKFSHNIRFYILDIACPVVSSVASWFFIAFTPFRIG